MFNLFNLKFRPFMDADSDVGEGTVTSQTTEPTEEATTVDDTGSVTDTQDSASDPASQKGQSSEMNRAFADLRRKAEAAERRAANLEAQRQRDVSIAKKYGKEYGLYSDADIAAKYGQSHGITTVEQLDAAIQSEQYRQQGVDPDLIKQIVNQDPDIMALKQQLIGQQGKALLESELRELSEEHPEIKKVEDLHKLPTFEKIQELVGKGYHLLDAYEAANRAEIRKQQSETARQATLNNIAGKSHIRGNGKGSEIDTTTIPDDVLEMYRTFNPGKSMDEYKAHYKKSLV